MMVGQYFLKVYTVSKSFISREDKPITDKLPEIEAQGKPGDYHSDEDQIKTGIKIKGGIKLKIKDRIKIGLSLRLKVGSRLLQLSLIPMYVF